MGPIPNTTFTCTLWSGSREDNSNCFSTGRTFPEERSIAEFGSGRPVICLLQGWPAIWKIVIGPSCIDDCYISLGVQWWNLISAPTLSKWHWELTWSHVISLCYTFRFLMKCLSRFATKTTAKLISAMTCVCSPLCSSVTHKHTLIHTCTTIHTLSDKDIECVMFMFVSFLEGGREVSVLKTELKRCWRIVLYFPSLHRLTV